MNGDPEKSPWERQVSVEIGKLSREMRMRLEAGREAGGWKWGTSSAGCME